MSEFCDAMLVSQGASRPDHAKVMLDPVGKGQVVLRIRAGGLNFADLLMTQGRYQDTPPTPFVPGLEGAGDVIKAGPDSGFSVGQRVAVYAQGTMAKAGVFDANRCIAIPDSMSYEQAAGFQIAYGTSHLALTARAGLSSKETLVVLGAGGGVGLTAVEIGAALGARVIAVARGPAHLEAATEAGANEVIDLAQCPDLKAALRDMGGADVVYDPVGDAPGLAAFGALRRGGRFLLIGFAGGKPPALPLNHALVKNIAVHGFYWGGYHDLDSSLMRNSLVQLLQMFDQGKLRPRLGHILPLDRLPEAYDLLESRRSVGKVVITM